MSFDVKQDNGLHKGPIQELNKTNIDFIPRPANGYAMELITGSAVTALLLDPLFQKSWDLLFESCSWATVFQSRQFITSWYRIYREKHLPVLIVEEKMGHVTGILPMVLLNANANEKNPRGKITGAGHYDAPYQTWLTVPSNGETFIKKALAELMKHFPGHPVSFRFLPSEAPLNWIKSDRKWRKSAIIQSYTRPLINFDDPAHVKLFQGKHIKAKLNRLKRLGCPNFERIRNYESFESSLDEMTVMYDFRQGAMFNKNHFKEEPLKKEFLLELFRLQLLHVTVLKINGKIVAGILATTAKDWVHLAGINCHSPFNAGWYSPGFIHITLLSKQLADEHIRYFDLTPGYDAYKELLANCHDEVKELVISNSLPFRVKKQIRKWLHACLIRMGVRPMTAELKVKKYFYQVQHWSAASAIKGLAESLRNKRKQQLYLIQASDLRSDVKISLQKDNLSDFLEFQTSKQAGLARWDFMADAMHRFERGQHCFTWRETGRLLACAWFSYPDSFPANKNNHSADNNCIVLQHIYYHPAAKNRLPSFLRGVINQLAVISEKEACSSPIFISSKYKTLL